MHNVSLKVNGRNYLAWTALEVDMSLDSACRVFSISSSKMDAEYKTIFVEPGAACELSIDGQKVITGYIDNVEESYENSSHSVNISGRCKTADLVDCSPDIEVNEWNDRSLDQIVKEICKPYGIDVKVEADTGAPFAKFRMEQGERCIDLIERLCRHRGLLRISDGDGNLVITSEADKAMPEGIKLGVNILSASVSMSMTKRFSTYRVKGQNVGTDNAFGEAVAAPFGEAKDPNVRHRVTTVIAEDIGNNQSLADRASWEANFRRAQGSNFSYKVLGLTSGSEIWEPNRQVFVEDQFTGVKGSLLISGVKLSLSDQGYKTTLTLAIPGSYKLNPIPQDNDNEGSLF